MIYGIFSGWYSDWAIIGYLTDEKQAKKYCEKMNNGRPERSKKYYFREMIALDGTEKEPERVAWEVNTEDWTINESYREEPKDGKTFEVNEFWPSVTLWLYPGEETKAVKIAQDCLAQWKAEREGVG